MLATFARVRFGHFQLDAHRRVLLADGKPVGLNGRCFDMLALLVERPGEVLGRNDIFPRVWPGRTVNDNNLTVQMSALRHVLDEHGGAGLIKTVPGHGYVFVGEVIASDSEEQTLPTIVGTRPSSRLSRLRGRWRYGLLGLMLTVAIGMAVDLSWRADRLSPRLSIAVLPFRNDSSDRSQDYLADALTDDLTTDLAHIPASTIIARESVDRYSDRPPDAQEIGRALHVRYLVRGRLHVEDARYFVNVHLVDADSGRDLWASRLPPVQGRLSEVRDTIVSRIATALGVQLDEIENTRSLSDRPNDPNALDLFFRARALVDADQSLSALTGAQSKLEQALAQQPDFADAQAELGAVLLMKVEDAIDPDETRDIKRAHDAIARALALSPRNAEALAARARELASQSRWADASYTAKAALAVEPSNVGANIVLARCARASGDVDAASAYMETVMRVTPDGLMNKRRYLVLGYIRLLQGRPDDAIELLQRALAGEENGSTSDIFGRVEIARLLLIAATLQSGDLDGARSKYKEYAALWPNRTIWRFAEHYSIKESRLPGFTAMLAALHRAGMPFYARETDPESQLPADADCHGNEFSNTPTAVKGAETWTTSELASHLNSNQPPIVIDIGNGAAIPPNAVWSDWTQSPESGLDFARRVLRTRPATTINTSVVVMGDGPFGCEPYQVTQALTKETKQIRVVWYRGGEEAWAAHGLPRTDARR